MEDYKHGVRAKQDRKKAGGPKWPLLFFLIGCVSVAFQLVLLFKPYYSGKKIYSHIRDQVVTDGEEGLNPEGDIDRFRVDFDELKRQNPDTVGWIRFAEPSVISYPIVKSSDNQEYLTRSFSAIDNKLGAIFVDMRNGPGWQDMNTIIYGHNLQVGGEMFSQLNAYMEEGFCTRHPYFYIYTPEGQKLTYQVFSASIVKAGSEFYKVEFGTEEAFTEWLEMCRNASFYQVNTELSKDSRIATLSTCTNGGTLDRYIVQGVLYKEELN